MENVLYDALQHVGTCFVPAPNSFCKRLEKQSFVPSQEHWFLSEETESEEQRITWLVLLVHRNKEEKMPVAIQSIRPPSKLLMLLEGRRALAEFGAFLGALPLLNLAPKGDGHPVLVLPGLMAGDDSTLPLRKYLEGRGYEVRGWGLGLNRGLREGVQERMLDLVREFSDLHGRKISIVGWSLGGIFARELAKMLPDRVRSVISLGSPFGGSPKSTNAWRVYEFASGQSVDDAHDVAVSVAPPVPTTAIYSRTDGICAWQGCVEKTSAQSESIEVQGSHCGLAVNPAVVYAVADRLAQPEGAWAPFDRSGWRSLIFPDTARWAHYAGTNQDI